MANNSRIENKLDKLIALINRAFKQDPDRWFSPDSESRRVTNYFTGIDSLLNPSGSTTNVKSESFYRGEYLVYTKYYRYDLSDKVVDTKNTPFTAGSVDTGIVTNFELTVQDISYTSGNLTISSTAQNVQRIRVQTPNYTGGWVDYSSSLEITGVGALDGGDTVQVFYSDESGTPSTFEVFGWTVPTQSLVITGLSNWSAATFRVNSTIADSQGANVEISAFNFASNEYEVIQIIPANSSRTITVDLTQLDLTNNSGSIGSPASEFNIRAVAYNDFGRATSASIVRNPFLNEMVVETLDFTGVAGEEVTGDLLEAISVSNYNQTTNFTVANTTNGTTTISGSEFTFTPTVGFTGTSTISFNILINGVVVDTAFINIEVTPNAFELVSSTPDNEASSVSNTADIVLTYNQNLVKGAGNIVIRNNATDAAIQTYAVGDADVTVVDNVVTITNVSITQGLVQYLDIPAGVFVDIYGQNNPAIVKGDIVFATEGGAITIGCITYDVTSNASVDGSCNVTGSGGSDGWGNNGVYSTSTTYADTEDYTVRFTVEDSASYRYSIGVSESTTFYQNDFLLGAYLANGFLRPLFNYSLLSSFAYAVADGDLVTMTKAGSVFTISINGSTVFTANPSGTGDYTGTISTSGATVFPKVALRLQSSIVNAVEATTAGGGSPTLTAPTVSFTFSIAGGTRDVTFNATGVAGSSAITGYSWDFGDTNTDSVEDPSHTYAADGTYTVVVTATDANGLTGTSTQTITVEIAPDVITAFERITFEGTDNGQSSSTYPLVTDSQFSLNKTYQIDGGQSGADGFISNGGVAPDDLLYVRAQNTDNPRFAGRNYFQCAVGVPYAVGSNVYWNTPGVFDTDDPVGTGILLNSSALGPYRAHWSYNYLRNMGQPDPNFNNRISGIIRGATNGFANRITEYDAFLEPGNTRWIGWSMRFRNDSDSIPFFWPGQETGDYNSRFTTDGPHYAMNVFQMKGKFSGIVSMNMKWQGTRLYMIQQDPNTGNVSSQGAIIEDLRPYANQWIDFALMVRPGETAAGDSPTLVIWAKFPGDSSYTELWRTTDDILSEKEDLSFRQGYGIPERYLGSANGGMYPSTRLSGFALQNRWTPFLDDLGTTGYIKIDHAEHYYSEYSGNGPAESQVLNELLTIFT